MTAYLLDTHAALFWWSKPGKLGGAGRDAIAAPSSTIFVSSASAWEIATKYRLGKLGDIGDPSASFSRLMRANDFQPLPVSVDHSLRGGLLVGKHRDPFDRLIAAQALMENLTVITQDRAIATFGCEVLW